MAEFKGLVTFKGKPLTLVGNEVNVGDVAPKVRLRASLVEDFDLDPADGKVHVFSVAPSVDTGICSAQLRKFNELASQLSADVRIWYITADTPMALGRFCGAEGIDRVKALSDYKDREFGAKYGVWQQELGLLARSAWVVGRDGKVAYKVIAAEMASHLDYDAALAAIRAVL